MEEKMETRFPKRYDERFTFEGKEISFSQCRCCEGTGFIYDTTTQGNVSFTAVPLLGYGHQKHVTAKPPPRLSIWQRIFKRIKLK